MEIRHLPIDSIEVVNRARRELGDLRPLMDSIHELGLLHPIGVAESGDSQYRVVYGERRLRACALLLWTEIPAVIVDVDALRAEHDENELRKDFTVSERVAIGQEIERRLGNRQGQRSDIAQPGPNLAQVNAGKTEAIAAKRSGFGGRTQYQKAKAVVLSGDSELIDKMDAGECSVHTAFRVVQGRKARETKGDRRCPPDREDHTLYSDADRRAALIGEYLGKIRYHLRQASKTALEQLPSKVLGRPEFVGQDVDQLSRFLEKLLELRKSRQARLSLVPSDSPEI
jgi:hypothetical protein